MQIVIDIPEEVKHKVYAYGLSLCPSDKEQLINAIMNGTPLPKGHGDLIDRDDLLADSYPIDDYAGNEVNIIDVMTVKMADTIIEAERA